MKKYEFKFKFKEVDFNKPILASDFKAKKGIVKCYTDVDSYEEIEKIVKDKLLGNNLYEVIKESHKRKFYCDIDCTDMSHHKDDFEVLICDIQNAISEEIKEEWDDLFFCVYDSTTPIKYSYHVLLLGYYLTDSKESLIFYNNMMKRIDNPLKKYIDKTVYTKNRCFRLLYCSKLGKNNIKILYEGNELNNHQKYKYTIISYIPSFYKQIKVFKSKNKNQKDKTPQPNKNTEKKFKDIPKQVLKILSDNGLEIRDVKDTYISLNRVDRNIKCLVCSETHNNENGLITRSDSKWYIKCNHVEDESKKRKLIFTDTNIVDQIISSIENIYNSNIKVRFNGKNYKSSELRKLHIEPKILIEKLRNEVDMCDLFYQMFKNLNYHLKFNKDAKIFLFDPKTALWNTNVSKSLVRKKIKNILGSCLLYYSSVIITKLKKEKSISKKTYFKNLKKSIDYYSKFSNSSNGIEKIYSLVKDECSCDLDIEFNNKCKFLFPIKDCKVVNLKTGEVEKRTKDHYFTFESDVKVSLNKDMINFIDKQMLKIMNHNKEMKNFLQEVLGYSLSGSMDEDYFYIWYGKKGSNGKSTITMLLHKLMGKFYSQLNKKVLVSSNASLIHETHLKNIEGKRLSVFGELKKGDKLRDDRLKKLTSDKDQITYRIAHASEERTFVPTSKIVIQTNFYPNIDVTDSAMMRIIVIPFEAVFKDKPKKKNEYKKDKDLVQKMKDNLDSFFMWLLEGSVRYFKRGKLVIPELCKKAKEKMVEKQDDIKQFVEECLEKDDTLSKVNSIETKEVWNLWLDWDLKDDMKKRDFFKKIPKCLGDKIRSNGKHIFWKWKKKN